MSTKRHCDTCDATEPELGTMSGRWIHVEAHVPLSMMPRTINQTYSQTTADRIAGDYCSISCLTRKMQAAAQDSRRQMMEVLGGVA